MDEPDHLLRAPAIASEIRGVRGAVGAYGGRAGLSSERVCDLMLAVSEAMANAVMHAYPDGRPGTVEVRARVVADALEVEVHDDGVGLRPRPDSPGAGFGLQLIDALADDADAVAAPDGGTRVTMRFAL